MKITFTGIDMLTRIQDIWRLLEDPRVELGVLYSANPDGRNRYPHEVAINFILGYMDGRGALHVCGAMARRNLMDAKLEIFHRACRIQVNGTLTPDEVEAICATYPEKQIITHHKPGNEALLSVQAPNHAILVDGSGGRGISPGGWVRPGTAKTVGFAGGLNPENVAGEVALIRAVAREPWWIDMEAGVRDERDWFSAERAVQVLLALRPVDMG